MRASVLAKHKGERKWRSPDIERWPERLLQTILSEDPDLIPFEDERRPIVMVDEFAVASGFVDLVGVGSTGSITICECKKEDNAEIRRTVVGQLFAYAAAIWRMSYEEFDDIWQAKTRPSMTADADWEARQRPPLAESVQAAAAERGLPFDPERFRSTVSENLRAGRFTLLLAVDEITPELKQIVEYLSVHMTSGVDVIALTLGYFSHGDVEVLVPRSYGLEAAAQKVVSAGRPLAPDESSFMTVVSNVAGEWAAPMVRTILAWAAHRQLEVWYGTGSTLGTMNIGLSDASGKRRCVIACRTAGDIEIEFNQLKQMVPFDAIDARLDLLRRLEPIEGAVRPDKHADSWPQVKLDSLRKTAALEEFLEVMGDVVDRVREASHASRP